jgi:hypothetical protein
MELRHRYGFATFSLLVTLICDSTGAGSARNSSQKKLAGNTFGSGSHYLSPFCYTSPSSYYTSTISNRGPVGSGPQPTSGGCTHLGLVEINEMKTWRSGPQPTSDRCAHLRLVEINEMQTRSSGMCPFDSMSIRERQLVGSLVLRQKFSLGTTYSCGLPYCEFCVTQVRTLLTPKTRYPVLYCVLILPLSVVRWKTFYDQAVNPLYNVPALATFITGIMFTLSGILNAFLYGLTRTKFLRPNERDEPRAPTLRQGIGRGATNNPSESGQTE